ncbi:hypothetical protein [Salinimonas iocasae]|nr:hypothetical protein [Salinimonas iocasae]
MAMNLCNKPFKEERRYKLSEWSFQSRSKMTSGDKKKVNKTKADMAVSA